MDYRSITFFSSEDVKVALLGKKQRRRLRKRHLQSEVALLKPHRTYYISFNTLNNQIRLFYATLLNNDVFAAVDSWKYLRGK